MLEDAEKSLPAELSNRFDLNRFFTFQRDIVNDELQDLVPDLIEDALENPTGTYQQVTRFQNEKLMDIDRSTIEIKQSLNDIFALLQNISKQGGSGDSILDDLLGALGLRGLMGGGRSGKKDGKSEHQKKIKKNRFRDLLKKLRGKGAGGLALGLLALFAADASSEDIDLKEFVNGIIDGEYNEEIGALAVPAAVAATPAAISAGKNATGAAYQKFRDVMRLNPAPPPPVSETLEQKKYRVKDLDPEQQDRIIKERMKRTGKTKAQILEQFASADDVKSSRLISAAQRGVTEIAEESPGFLKRVASNIKGETSRLIKGTALFAVAYALYDFYVQLMDLPDNLTEQQYHTEIAKLASKTVALTGLTAFGAFVGGLVSGTIFGAIGSVVGPKGTAIVGGIGAVVGFLAGMAGALVFDAYYGAEVEEISQDPQFIALVTQLVGFIIKTHKMGVKAYDTVSETIGNISESFHESLKPKPRITKLSSKDEFANLTPEQLSAKGLKRLPQVQTGRGGKSPYTSYEIIDPEKYQSQSKAVAKKEEAAQAAPPAGVSDAVETKTEIPSEESSILDKFTPAALLSGFAGNLGDVGASKLQGLNALASELSTTKLNGTNISDIDIGKADLLGNMGGTSGLLSLMGVGNKLTPEAAEELGISPEEAQSINSELEKKSSTSQVLADSSTSQATMTAPIFATPQEGRTIKGLTGIDPRSNMQETLEQHFASLAQELSAINAVPTNPSITVSGFPQFTSTPIPASMAISAMRGNGLADVYTHPLSGPTMERMDRGGETHFG